MMKICRSRDSHIGLSHGPTIFQELPLFLPLFSHFDPSHYVFQILHRQLAGITRTCHVATKSDAPLPS